MIEFFRPNPRSKKMASLLVLKSSKQKESNRRNDWRKWELCNTKSSKTNQVKRIRNKRSSKE
jgi:hypothetical protein